ncbi:class I SAM-dependent methyltransferase [Marinicella meishanensis]|uniref:class I SAM-dependent methyltransferase n=1 Tax=Marinicella meishanensis TaxID=2873263 RepID=UPI001CBB196E|nr:class I SAM-dependent methyltransferase [Marinicella sp. NBU2979]
MKWDYTKLAKNYHKRAPYAPELIKQVTTTAQLQANASICDMGAGTGFLAREFAQAGFHVLAVEPNANMRQCGIEHCADLTSIQWSIGQAEQSGLPDHCADLISFGSSFNVVEQDQALAEAHRIVRPGGWFLIIWNHRVLDHGLQRAIEQCIHRHLPDYDYGQRRQDHQHVLESCGHFSQVIPMILDHTHQQTKTDMYEAWQSHATLQRQAKDHFPVILNDIQALIQSEQGSWIHTPYQTRGWLAQFKSQIGS